MRRGWFFLLFTALACEEPLQRYPCGVLPDPSACPASRGGSCEDRSCSALYECKANSWVFVETCAQKESGGAGGVGGTGQAGNSLAGASLCEVSNSTECSALQLPDCDESLLKTCTPDEVCELGCEGFLRCEGGEWSVSYVAYCNEEGEVKTP